MLQILDKNKSWRCGGSVYRACVLLMLSAVGNFGSLPTMAQQQQFILRQPSQTPAPAATSPRRAATRAHKGAPLPFSSLIEVEVPKHVPLEKISISSDLMFEPSKDRLTEAGEAKLKSLIPLFRKLRSHPVKIVAHTDSLGFETYNTELTLRQAQRIKSWLVAHGLAKAVAIETIGAGSQSPLMAETSVTKKDAASIRARNRRVEITIDPNTRVESEKVAAQPTAAPAGAENPAVPVAVPPELDAGLVDSAMKPVSEEDLNPNFVPPTGDNEKSAHHNVNNAEWGRGGSDFGNNMSQFGQMSGYAGDPSQYNQDGKRVVKVTPTNDDLEAKRRETIEAQNEFGLWRDK